MEKGLYSEVRNLRTSLHDKCIKLCSHYLAPRENRIFLPVKGLTVDALVKITPILLRKGLDSVSTIEDIFNNEESITDEQRRRAKQIVSMFMDLTNTIFVDLVDLVRIKDGYVGDDSVDVILTVTDINELSLLLIDTIDNYKEFIYNGQPRAKVTKSLAQLIEERIASLN